MFKIILLSSALLLSSCSDKKQHSNIEFIPISKDDLNNHCSFVEYSSRVCEEVRFILYHNYAVKGLCSSDNLLCTDYYGSMDYTNDYDIYEDMCSRSDQTDEITIKACSAYSYLVSNNLLVSPL